MSRHTGPAFYQKPKRTGPRVPTFGGGRGGQGLLKGKYYNTFSRVPTSKWYTLKTQDSKEKNQVYLEPQKRRGSQLGAKMIGGHKDSFSVTFTLDILYTVSYKMHLPALINSTKTALYNCHVIIITSSKMYKISINQQILAGGALFHIFIEYIQLIFVVVVVVKNLTELTSLTGREMHKIQNSRLRRFLLSLHG